MLLEVGGHGGVAGQSLTGAFQPPLSVNDPGPGAGYRVQRQPLGLLSTEVGVVVLEHSGDVVQEVVEELRDALVPWEDKTAQKLFLLMSPQRQRFPGCGGDCEGGGGCSTHRGMR